VATCSWSTCWRKGNCNRQLPQSRSSQSANRNLDSVVQVTDYSGLWGALLSFPKRRPFATNLILAGCLMPIADLNVQSLEGKGWDKQRTAIFCGFGLWTGTCYWFVYITLFGRLFPQAIRFTNLSWAEKLKDRVGQKQLVGQIACDLLLYVPLCYFPCFYMFKASVIGESLVEALAVYRTNCFEDNVASLGFWIPGDVLCFAVPAWMRLPVSHAVSFIWNTGLSWLRYS